MRLYRIGALWRGTEAEAKAAAREAGQEWQKVEVPTDKPGLLAFLNQPPPVEPDEIAATAEPAPTRPGTCPACDRSESAAVRAAESQDLAAIVGFIFDGASPSQVESIFSALGTRFHELRKAAAAARS
jgi:hypothetical protein